MGGASVILKRELYVCPPFDQALIVGRVMLLREAYRRLGLLTKVLDGLLTDPRRSVIQRCGAKTQTQPLYRYTGWLVTYH